MPSCSLSVSHASCTSPASAPAGCASVSIAGRLPVSASTWPASALVMKSM